MIWVCCVQGKEMQQAFPKVITSCYPLPSLERLHKKKLTFIHVETESIIL